MVRVPFAAQRAGRHVAWLVVLGGIFLPVAAHGTTYRIVTGRYTGDGASSRSITTLGFQPDAVFVKGAVGAATVVRTSSMSPGGSKPLGTSAGLVPNGVVAFSASGFGVGNDNAVNAPTTSYFWIAFAAGPDVMITGSYTGDGQDNRHLDVGFQPAYVIVLGENSQLAMQRFASEPANACLPFVDSAERGNCIQNFDTTGFTVGTDASVNTNGTVYHYIAWKAALEVVSDGVYVGDGSASHDLVTGYQPEFAVVTRGGAGSPTVLRSDSLAADQALYCDATGGLVTGAIRQFLPTGFRVGADATVNSVGANYYYVAFNTAADLEVTKTIAAPAAAPGDTVSYLVTAANHGPGALTTIRVDDFLPGGITHLTNTASQGSYTPASGRWLVGTLAGGVSATLSIQATVNAGASGGIVNTASSTVFDGSGDPNLTNNGSSVAVTIQTGDLAVAKRVDDTAPPEGRTITYTVDVDNLGALATSGIVVTDLLPAGVEFESYTATHGVYTSATGTWSVGTLDPLERATLQLAARVGFGTAGVPITNTATLTTANQVELIVSNDTSSVVITPIAAPNTDLALQKTVDDPHPDEGGGLDYTVTLTNLGPNPGTGIEVLDLLPAALPYVAHTASQGSYDPVTGIWNVGGLGLGASVTLTLTTTLATGANVPVVTNTAAIRRADQFDPVATNDLARVDIRTVQTEPLPIGTSRVLPGTPAVPLLVLRLTNHETTPTSLSGLRLGVSTGMARLQLWRDDGDLVLEPLVDALLATGTPQAGTWTVNGTLLDLAPTTSATLLVSADVSLMSAPQGLVLGAGVGAANDITWTTPITMVTTHGFPLTSPGSVTVADLVQAQIGFTPVAADSTVPGATAVPLLLFHIPDDGGSPDVLQRIDVMQRASAVSGVDIARVHLQLLGAQDIAGAGRPAEDAAPPRRAANAARPATTSSGGPPAIWIDVDVVQFFHTGGERWSASGFALPIPAGGLDVRVVADVADGAREGRALRGELPTSALVFGSGRRGPEDLAWTNPDSTVVRAERVLEVSQASVAGPSAPVRRGATRIPVLGLVLKARSAADDTLLQLRLLHTSTGPEGPATDPSAEVTACELWRDVDADGALDPNDAWIAAALPDPSGVVQFGATTALGVALPSGTAVQLLVTLTPDSVRVRDAESLRVRLVGPGDLVTVGALAVQLPGALETLVPPVVDGQSAVGYAIGTVAGGALLAGTPGTVVLELALPSNGIDADVLQSFRIENDGTATAADVSAVQLLADDGDHRAGPGDALVARLEARSGRMWEATGIGWPLAAATPLRYLVVVDVAPSPQSGATFRVRIPRAGITVASGNDGPIDTELLGSNPYVFSVPDRITWIAGSAGDHVVRPDADRQGVMVLELFNGYAMARTLSGLELVPTGTITPAELQNWTLVADDNENGVLDPTDRNLATATLADERVRFTGFAYDLAPQNQQRLLVAYSLAIGAVRDGSAVDVALVGPAAIEYAELGTVSDGAFPLDSPGIDLVDGCVRAQVGTRPVASRTLGANETNVLVLDLLLPANGWQADTLRALQLESAASDSAALFGPDIQSLWLWQESGTSPGFDPAQDVRLQSAVAQGNGFVFSSLVAPIPAVGVRFYISLDTAPAPTAGRRVELRVPVLGIEMASANDGPLDVPVEPLATHRFSADDLLASVGVTPERASRGQPLEVIVHVRNQGTMAFDRVVPVLLAVEPPGAATLVDGPLPLALALAPQAEGSFVAHFVAATTGTVRFMAQVADSTTSSDVVTSVPIVVDAPPTALDASFASSLPPAVNRGSTVTTLVTQVAHPDAATGTADILVTAIQFVIEDADGNAQPAASVFDRLVLQSGGVERARLESFPDTTRVQLALTPPVRLRGNETLDMALLGTIATQATARSVRLRVAGATAIAAVDANSMQSVAVRATLPWTTQSSTIHTPSSTLSVALQPTLPLAVNRGQRDIPAGRFVLTLPGALDESEARLVGMSIVWRDTSGAPLAPAGLAQRLSVRNGTTTLLEVTDFGTDATLVMPLAIPQLVASGAPQTLDLILDIRNDTSVPGFALVLLDSTAFTVRDATSGTPVTAVPTTGFPWSLGPARIETPAGDVVLNAVSLTPPSTYPGARNLPVARLSLQRDADPIGSADVELTALTFRTIDDRGSELVDVLSSARVSTGGTTLAATGAPSGSPWVTLTFATPVRIAPGARLDLDVEVDLAATVSTPWLRFGFEPLALALRDANDTMRVLATTGDLPFATELVRIVAPPLGVAAGPVAEPPANVSSGATAKLLDLRLVHPGSVNEAAIQPISIVLRLADAQGAPLAPSSVVAAAHLELGGQTFAARLAADSIVVGIAALPALSPGESHDLALHVDFVSDPQVADFRLALDAAGVDARAGGIRLETRPLPGSTLPWLSATVHIGATNLRESLSSYPNPFTPAVHGDCHITFFLGADAEVSAEIYTVTGDRVRNLLHAAPLAAGLHDDLRWDGRNGAGDLVRNGTYLLRLIVSGASGGEFIRKVAVKR